MITPLAWPMTTFSSTLLSRSKARPFSGSTCLPTTGNPRRVELEDEVALGPLGGPEVRQPDGVGVVGPGAGQVAARALPALDRGQPGAARDGQVAADVPGGAGGVDVAALLVDAARSRARRGRSPAGSRRRRRRSSRSGAGCRSRGSGRPSPAEPVTRHRHAVRRVERLVAPTAGRIDRHEPPRRLDRRASTPPSGVTHPTYRKGTGPGVVVIHEIPGMTPRGDRVRARRSWRPGSPW